VLLLDDHEVGDLDGADEGEPEVLHEEAAHLAGVDVRVRQIDPEPLGRETAAVGEGDTGVEVRSNLGLSKLGRSNLRREGIRHENGTSG
jgi:hypothetical protein